MKLAVCQNEIDISSDRRGTVVRGHGVHVHIENHGVHFSCLNMQPSAPQKLTAAASAYWPARCRCFKSRPKACGHSSVTLSSVQPPGQKTVFTGRGSSMSDSRSPEMPTVQPVISCAIFDAKKATTDATFSGLPS